LIVECHHDHLLLNQAPNPLSFARVLLLGHYYTLFDLFSSETKLSSACHCPAMSVPSWLHCRLSCQEAVAMEQQSVGAGACATAQADPLQLGLLVQQLRQTPLQGS
jgi:hypothetical protein